MKLALDRCIRPSLLIEQFSECLKWYLCLTFIKILGSF